MKIAAIRDELHLTATELRNMASILPELTRHADRIDELAEATKRRFFGRNRNPVSNRFPPLTADQTALAHKLRDDGETTDQIARILHTNSGRVSEALHGERV